jgi:hypothetical protein
VVGAFLVDGAPVVATLQGSEEAGAIVFPQQPGVALPAVPAIPAGAHLDEPGVLALAPLLAHLADGLYTLELSQGGPLHVARVGWTPDVAGMVDLDVAVRHGGAVLAVLSTGERVVLAGRDQARQGPPVWLLKSDVILGAPGFEARHHDRGAREAFARSPDGVLADVVLRDALAHLRAVDADIDVGPFTEDRTEPAAQQARALVWDLRAEDGIESVSDTTRERVGDATEMRARVRVKSVSFEIAFVSHDGRRVDEVLVRSQNRFRATGLRPAARTLARSLRQLADEGA